MEIAQIKMFSRIHILCLSALAAWHWLVQPVSGQSALPAYEFQTARQSSGWQAANHIAGASFTPDGLQFTITGNDPFLLSPPNSFTPGTKLCLHLRLKSETGGRGQVFFFQKNYNEEDSVWFHAEKNAWTEVRLPLPPLGSAIRFRLDPPGGSGRCVISYFRVEPMEGLGVTEATATAKEILLTTKNEGLVHVVEVPFHQSYTAAASNAPIVLSFPGSRTLQIPRFDKDRDRLYSGFVAIRTNSLGQRETLGPIRYIERPANISQYPLPYPTSASKKGLQVQMIDDALTLGIKHAALNLNLGALIDPAKLANNYTWKMDGEVFHFNRVYLDSLRIKQLSDAGVNVSLILLAYANNNPARDVLLHPWYDASAPNKLGAFNVRTAEGVKWLRAAMEFLAERYSRPDAAHGQVWGYIVGNEVNSHWHWYNLGNARPDLVAQEYEKAVRLVHLAVRKFSPSARVYLSLEHHWNVAYERNQFRTCTGRGLLEDFNRFAQMNGNYDWHLAFHPYPENLNNPRTWEDKSATPTPDTPRITFRNLHLLPAYLSQPDLLYYGQHRRIILSEQGFNSLGTLESELEQAAAYCYAYRKVEAIAGIDSFIYHRHVDHSHEGGLNLGLWRRQPDSIATPASQKPIYRAFQAADTVEWPAVFDFALPIIGIKRWDEIMKD
jgi:hypothetical protein